jgi:hypothetical protein
LLPFCHIQEDFVATMRFFGAIRGQKFILTFKGKLMAARDSATTELLRCSKPAMSHKQKPGLP